jgi:hypothetical protein
MDDSIHERGRALGEHFFKEKDKQLLEKLRRELAAKETREALAQACAINDVAVLDAMIAHQVTPESLTSLSLVPLIAVAWADGQMEHAETDAILKAAGNIGIQHGSTGYQLLESWLSRKPAYELYECWTAYIGALKEKLEPAAFQQLEQAVLSRTRQVAEAAGGFLGLGKKISEAEQRAIDQLAAAFK